MKSLVYDVLITIACLVCVYLVLQPNEFRSITQFQQELIKDGYELPKHGADGQLGDETETAWNAKFQALNGE